MSIEVTTTGNGRFKLLNQSDYILSYSIEESATPIAASDTSGEIPSLSIDGESNSDSASGTLRPNSLLMVDNSITIKDDLRGEFTGRVTGVSVSDGIVSVSALSSIDKLNAKRRMSPFYGSVKQAYEFYFTQAGLSSGEFEVDASLATPSNLAFPGWNDVIWAKLKAFSAVTKNEMYFDKNKIVVKPIGSRSFNLEDASDENYSVELGEKTKTFSINLEKTKPVNDVIIYAPGSDESAETVEYNEVKEIVVTTPVSLSSVNQPEYVQYLFGSHYDWIKPGSIGTVPTEYPDGFYSFIYKNGRSVPPKTASDLGASVKVKLGDADNEIKLIITGPNLNYSTPWTVSFGGSSKDTPAIGITGSGVLVESTSTEFATGSSVGDDVTEYSDLPFAITSAYLYDSAYNIAQDLCGPKVILSFNTDKIVEANGQEFGFLPGAIFSYNGSKFRVVQASYKYDSISVTAEQYVTFADFNAVWSGKTFAQFNDVMLTPDQSPTDYMKYSDLAILPLMGQ